MHTPLLITSAEVHKGNFWDGDHHKTQFFFPYFSDAPGAPQTDSSDKEGAGNRRRVRDMHACGQCTLCLVGAAHVYAQGYLEFEKIRRTIGEVLADWFPDRHPTSVVGFNDSVAADKTQIAAVWNEAMRRLGWDVPDEYLDPERL